jgi:hypothetical protein
MNTNPTYFPLRPGNSFKDNTILIYKYFNGANYEDQVTVPYPIIV